MEKETRQIAGHAICNDLDLSGFFARQQLALKIKAECRKGGRNQASLGQQVMYANPVRVIMTSSQSSQACTVKYSSKQRGCVGAAQWVMAVTPDVI